MGHPSCADCGSTAAAWWHKAALAEPKIVHPAVHRFKELPDMGGELATDRVLLAQAAGWFTAEIAIGRLGEEQKTALRGWLKAYSQLP